MSYIANKYNYATPLASAAGLVNDNSVVRDVKYFTLHDNVLDGTYFPLSGDTGLWGNSISASDGTLPEPFVVTVTENLTINAFRLISASYCYPVAFTVQFYNSSELLYTIDETANTEYEYVHYMRSTLVVTSYVITISKLNTASAVARVYNAYNPGYVKRVDTLSVATDAVSEKSIMLLFQRSDSLAIVHECSTHIENTIDTTYDTLSIKHLSVGTPTNIHTIMKDPSRRVYGKVYITYTDPMLESETVVDASSVAYNSSADQVMDMLTTSSGKFFTLYDNDLTGYYEASDADSQIGWVSAIVSDENGEFVDPPWVRKSFAERPIISLPVTFDTSHGCVATDFTATFTLRDGSEVVNTFTGNTDETVDVILTPIPGVVSVAITVQKVSKPGYPAAVLEIPLSSTVLYRGYQNASELMSVDLLEELTYQDDVEALGGVSANETTIVIDNSKHDFFFNNELSPVASHLKRNRKIVPWLGVEIVKGEIEWYTLGTFWSYRWSVPVDGLTATVVGFDTIGLLDTTSFVEHDTLVNYSIGDLIRYVLEDAKKDLGFIEYVIDPYLDTIIIPYAWFDAKSHTAALRKISLCFPMHIYCDRLGRIIAAPQKLHLDFYYDVWADNTNVIDKTYSSLYTALPNIVNVTVCNARLATGTELVKDEVVFNVASIPERTLNFSYPYVSDLIVTVDCDASVQYTYEAHSWGINMVFTGAGTVRSITCIGTSVDTSSTSVVTYRDNDSVRFNGAVVRDVQADFIQTSTLAGEIISRIRSLTEYDKYDATVNYRGDISLTINDPILLLNGIAPDNRYNIKRHQLSWNGSLTGSADLNT